MNGRSFFAKYSKLPTNDGRRHRISDISRAVFVRWRGGRRRDPGDDATIDDNLSARWIDLIGDIVLADLCRSEVVVSFKKMSMSKI